MKKDWQPDELVLHWSLSPDEHDLLGESGATRLNFAILLKAFSTPRALPRAAGRHRRERRSSLGLDLYMWLSYKTFTLYSQGKKPERLSRHLPYDQSAVTGDVRHPALGSLRFSAGGRLSPLQYKG